MCDTAHRILSQDWWLCNHSQIIEELPVFGVHLRLVDVHVLIGEVFPIFGESDLAIGDIEVGVVAIEEPVSQEDLLLALHRLDVGVTEVSVAFGDASLHVDVVVDLVHLVADVDVEGGQFVVVSYLAPQQGKHGSVLFVIEIAVVAVVVELGQDVTLEVGRNGYAGVARVEEGSGDVEERGVGDADALGLDLVGKSFHQRISAELSLVQILVGLSEGNVGSFVLLEVEIDTEGVLLDDLVVDECLDKSGVAVPSQLREGEANQTLRRLEVVGGGEGDQQGFVEFVRTDLDGQIGFVSLQCSIQVGDGDLLPIAFAAGTRVFLVWTAGGIFSLDEQIAGSSVDVEIVVKSSNGHAESEVVAHVVEPVAFGCCLMGEMGGWQVEGPHVMPHTVLFGGQLVPFAG